MDSDLPGDQKPRAAPNWCGPIVWLTFSLVVAWLWFLILLGESLP
jgi:hypothetical protein